MELLGFPHGRPGQSRVEAVCPPGPAGAGWGGSSLIKEDIEYSSISGHVPSSQDGPFILSFGFGLSRREATVHSFNASSEFKYFPALEEENRSKGNSTKETFVPCSLDLDL